MNPANFLLKTLIRGSFPARQVILYCVLLIISLLIHQMIVAQQLRQKVPQRKPMIVNKANNVFQNNVTAQNGNISISRGLCDFTLTPVNASTNSLSQIIQSLVGSGITISNIQSNLPATSDIYGSFSCGSAANLGMESGLLLTTGVIGNAKGPNVFSGASTDNFRPGSDTLASLTGGGEGFDASIVSFNIVSNTKNPG